MIVGLSCFMLLACAVTVNCATSDTLRRLTVVNMIIFNITLEECTSSLFTSLVDYLYILSETTTLRGYSLGPDQFLPREFS